MQLNINVLDDKAALFLELLKSLDFVVSVEPQKQEELLSVEEKNILDKRWAKYEKEGIRGTSWEDFKAEIKKEHGI
jgi:hypothetical protein